MSKSRFDEAFLEKLRRVPLPETLDRLDVPWRIDESFKPRKRPTERCILVWIADEERRIVYDGLKWTDQTKKISGGGAIDVLVKLFGYDFVGAVRALKCRFTE